MPRIIIMTDEQFADKWNASLSLAEVAQFCGNKKAWCKRRAWLLRNEGKLKLKKFASGPIRSRPVPYEPTAKEIAATCLEIQETWSAANENQHRVTKTPECGPIECSPMRSNRRLRATEWAQD